MPECRDHRNGRSEDQGESGQVGRQHARRKSIGSHAVRAMTSFIALGDKTQVLHFSYHGESAKARALAGWPMSAERAGFEPAVGFDPHAALAKRCYRPLSHLSRMGRLPYPTPPAAPFKTRRQRPGLVAAIQWE